MHVEAVDLICAFELEEKFPPLPLLSSFVKKNCEAGIEERRQGQCPLRSLVTSIIFTSVFVILTDKKVFSNWHAFNF